MKNKKFLTIVCLILIIILSSCILFLINRNSYNNNENPLVNTTLEGNVKIKKNDSTSVKVDISSSLKGINNGNSTTKNVAVEKEFVKKLTEN